MTMIGEICRRDVVVTTPNMSVLAAAKLMRQRHVGSVVVVDRSGGGLAKPLGVITDRDIVVRVTAIGLDAETIPVGEMMCSELVTIRADRSVLEAMETMRMKGIRRLPVVTEDGGLIGLVSFDDLLEFLTEALTDLARTVGREQAREAT